MRACGTLPGTPLVATSVAQAATPTSTSYLPIVSKPGTSYDWLQFMGDASHSGNNTLEKAISPANVSQLHLLFQVALPAVADGAPVYLSNVATVGGIHWQSPIVANGDLYLEDQSGHLTAFSLP